MVNKKRKQEDDWEELVPNTGESPLDGVESAEIAEMPQKNLDRKDSRRNSSENEDVQTELETEDEDDTETDEFDELNRKKIAPQPIAEKDQARIEYSAQDLVALEGDFIEIDFEDGLNKRITRGKIVGMYSDRKVPDVDEDIAGTPQDPAIKVEIYTNENGKWKRTKHYVGMKLSQLQRSGQSFP